MTRTTSCCNLRATANAVRRTDSQTNPRYWCLPGHGCKRAASQPKTDRRKR